MKKSRIFTVLVVLVLVLSLVLTACSTPSPTPSPTQAPPTTQAPTTTQPPATKPTTTTAPTTAAPSPTPTPASFTAISVTYANPNTAKDLQTVLGTVNPFTEAVNKRWGGKFQVTVHSDGSLLSYKEMVKGVSSGVADMGFMQTSYDPSLFNSHAIDYLPLFRGTPAYDNIIIARIMHEEFPVFNEEMDKQNLMVIYKVSTGPLDILTSKKVEKLEDIKGLRLRTSGKYGPMFLEAAGAVPVAMHFSDVYEATQKGVIDGGVSTPTAFRDGLWSKVAKYFVYWRSINALGSGMFNAMSITKWKSLPLELRKVMLEEGKKVEAAFGKTMDQQDLEAIETMKKNDGMITVKLTAAEMQTWESKTPDLLEAYSKDMAALGIPGDKIVARLKQLLAMSTAEREKLFDQAWEKNVARLLAM
ncbi:MAG: TRAP transporter substrate-binding protein DctP [Chloroflexi bacterium]|nr:TRAP transporter substrate-binding protein DctP [Chloroflexota bacterium]